MNDNGECWEKAYPLIKAGKEDAALKFCQQEPCSSTSVDCQRYVGKYYYKICDNEKAMFWFSLSAKSGDPESIYGLACIYDRMEKHSAAFDYFKEAAGKNYPRAEEKGSGIEKA